MPIAASAAAFEFYLLGGRNDLLRLVVHGLSGNALATRSRLAGVDVESGVGHPERLPDDVGEMAAEALADDLLDDRGENVEGFGVFEHGPGLIDERQLGDRVDELGARLHARQRRAAWVEVGNGASRIRSSAVGEARGVPQEVVDADRTLLRFVLDFARRVPGGDLHRGEVGKIIGEPAIERQPAMLGQRQHPDRRHDLGHRRKPEDRIDPHGLAGLLVLGAVSLQQDELAVARDSNDGARHAILRLSHDRRNRRCASDLRSKSLLFPARPEAAAATPSGPSRLSA